MYDIIIIALLELAALLLRAIYWVAIFLFVGRQKWTSRLRVHYPADIITGCGRLKLHIIIA